MLTGQQVADAISKLQAVHVARDRVTASAARTTLTLGAIPVVNSPLIWKNGALLWPITDYTISGAAVTFNVALIAGDVIADYYTTTSASAAVAVLS